MVRVPMRKEVGGSTIEAEAVNDELRGAEEQASYAEGFTLLTSQRSLSPTPCCLNLYDGAPAFQGLAYEEGRAADARAL